jgi:hypothetical protein
MHRKLPFLLVAGLMSACIDEASGCWWRHCRHCSSAGGSRSVARDMYYANESRDYVTTRDIEYVPVRYRLVSDSRSLDDTGISDRERGLLDKLLVEQVIGEAFDRVIRPKIKSVVDERLNELNIRPGSSFTASPGSVAAAADPAARILQLEAQLRECRDCIRQLQTRDGRSESGVSRQVEPQALEQRPGRDF